MASNASDQQQVAEENRPLLNHDDHEQQEDQGFDPDHPPSDHHSFASSLKRHLSIIFSPLSKPEQLSPLEKFLVALSILLLLLASVFIGLFAGSQHRLSHPPAAPVPTPAPGNPIKTPPPPEEVCTTKDCVLAASEILRGIDESIDPCDDFYSFATNGWLKEHPIPADAGLFGVGQYVASQNAKVIKKILELAPHPSSSAQGSNQAAIEASTDDEKKIDRQNLAKLRGFYDSCVDLESQDKRGPKPLMDVIFELKHRLRASEATELEDETSNPLFVQQQSQRQHVSGKPVPPNKPPGRAPKPHPPKEDPTPSPPSGPRQQGLTEALAWAHSRGLPVLFEWIIDGDAVKDPLAGTPYLAPSGLGLPDKDYYKDQDELDFYLSVVQDGLEAIAAEEEKVKGSGAGLGGDADLRKRKGGKGNKQPRVPISRLAEEVVDFEKQLADITPDSEELYDPLGTYNPVNASSLPYRFASLDWPTYLSALTVRTPATVILLSPKFLTSLDSLVSRTRNDVLEAYISWTALRTLGTALGPHVALRKPAERLERYTKGVDEDAKEDRETLCLSELNSALGFMAGRYYVQEAFPEESKKRVEQIIASIIKAFKDRLPDLDWLDDETRAKAEEKADAVKIKVGYPKSPNTTDAASVASFYADLEVDSRDYFGNRLRSSTRISKRDWAQSGRRMDVERWDMFPAEVNAEYSPQGNYILFPAGFIQPPYFSPTWPSYLQLGAFGAAAGHELSHAFDPDGRLYDKDGYLKDWWTEETAREFQKRQMCISDQYHSYTIEDGKGGELHLKSNFTIGEDVADAGGLAQSFRAWREEYDLSDPDSKRVNNSLLPGLGYTREQLFFISYALSWSRNIRTGEAIRRLRTDPHSPTKFRVIGPLSNNQDFIQAFGCKPGKDRMARKPEQRCEIW
ncbi:zincin [Violaceomyces palustris]|uniref:Zincin n=1 Tax=Violaceomyces palustris TaxID=1673888 RepID=A0ACD0P340_9BASI|nr:zincin [Violaceomyces palustris]